VKSRDSRERRQGIRKVWREGDQIKRWIRVLVSAEIGARDEERPRITSNVTGITPVYVVEIASNICRAGHISGG
jgi:hypothetical protein